MNPFPPRLRLLLVGVWLAVVMFHICAGQDCAPAAAARDPNFVPNPVVTISPDVPYVLDFKSNSGHLTYSSKQIEGHGRQEKVYHLQVVLPGELHYDDYRPQNKWWDSAQWILHSSDVEGVYTISNKDFKDSLIIATQQVSSSDPNGNWVGLLTSGGAEFMKDETNKKFALWRMTEVVETPKVAKVIAIFSNGYPSNGMLAPAAAPGADQYTKYQFVQAKTQGDPSAVDLLAQNSWTLGLASEEERNPFTSAAQSNVEGTTGSEPNPDGTC